MDALSMLLSKPKVAKASNGDGVKAENISFQLDTESKKVKVSFEIDANELITGGKSTTSGKEKFTSIIVQEAPFRLNAQVYVKL